MCVVNRVFDHARGQRTPGPIRFLRTFGQFYAEMPFNQSGQAKFLNSQQSGRDYSIEDPIRLEIKRSAKQSQIKIGAVNHNLFFLQKIRERLKTETGQWID